jgi:alpha-L-fucosidase
VKALSKPTVGQLAWQEAGFGVFFHFGVNTFNGREWSDGTLSPETFSPVDFDAAQWIGVVREAGAKYVVLTAKHHDGFCLWPTDTTDYSVKSSPWRDGKSDVVGELAQACREAGLGFGLYLSPWDRNTGCYADPEAYDRFYAAQLTELCTRYGELFEIWFDGAGSEGRSYDWEANMTVIDEHQPQAMVFNMGRRTIRWAGNEDGLASEPVTYVKDGVYLPPECDVAIRAHWFWQADDAHTLKSKEHLLAIWYRSIGLGAGLLLNLGPDPQGRIDDADAARLIEVSTELAQRFANPIASTLDGEVASFGEPVTFDHLELREDLLDGQHLDGYRIMADGKEIARGQTVGIRRWHAFPAVTASQVTIEGAGSHLKAVTAFSTGHEAAPELENLTPADQTKFREDG